MSRFFSLSSIRCPLFFLLPYPPWLLFQPLVRLRFQRSYLLRFHTTPLLPLYPSLRKQFIRLFVFRLDVPRGLFRFLSQSFLPFLLPSLDVPVTFSNDLGARLNCFPIRHLSNVRSRRTQRKFVLFVLSLLCKSLPLSCCASTIQSFVSQRNKWVTLFKINNFKRIERIPSKQDM